MYKVALTYDSTPPELLDMLLIESLGKGTYAYAYSDTAGIRYGTIREHRTHHGFWNLVRRCLRDDTHESNKHTKALVQVLLDTVD